MKTILLKQDAVFQGNLILVNAQHPLHEASRKAILVPVSDGTYEIQLEQRSAAVLCGLMEAIDGTGEIVAVSGYRSPLEQKRIYAESLIKNGQEFTSKYVALPNHSEHQTGLAVDVAYNQPDIDTLRPHFPYSGICQSFRQKAPLYGFIERYPAGKETITGIAHEPWHFRYVGFPHSAIIQERAFTLEEYLDYLREVHSTSAPLIYSSEQQVIEVIYYPISMKETKLEIHGDLSFQISGDNKCGVIVTLWRDEHEQGKRLCRIG